MSISEERIAVLSSGCKICYQVLGDPSHDAILLVCGHSSSMTQRTDELVQLLNPPENPHYIVRFDHRDTGRSSTFPIAAPDDPPPYTMSDLVDDIVGLIQHLRLTRVHIIGMSMGGPLAWQAAVRLPETIKSLALVLTSPVGRQQLPSDKLPPMHLEGQWLLGEAFDPPQDKEDDEGWIRHYMAMELCLSTQPPTEAEKLESRKGCELTYRREKESGALFTKFNHSATSGDRWPRELLKDIKCPTVVMHGGKDQLFPMGHATALRDDIQGATLVVLDDCGHELPQRVRPRVAQAILDNAK